MRRELERSRGQSGALNGKQGSKYRLTAWFKSMPATYPHLHIMQSRINCKFIFNSMFTIKRRYSKAVEAIAVSPLRKVAVVRYRNGNEYTYRNVNRLKLINLMINDCMSLGFWVQGLRGAVQQNRYNVQTGVMTYDLTNFTVNTDERLLIESLDGYAY